MKHIVIFFGFLLFGIHTSNSQKHANLNVSSQFIIKSDILDEERKCLINLPDWYNDSTKSEKKYPIIILLDGYTHFKTTSGIVHFMSSRRNGNELMPAAIIVAIENVDRERDFTITKLKTKRPNTMGGGKNFVDFIAKELIPHLDTSYRTKPNRILVGHSLGGQLALNTYMNYDNIFDGYLSIDPSIWWHEKIMSEKVDAIHPTSFKKKLYIATANQGEAKFEKNKKRHDTFFKLLKSKAGTLLNAKIDYFENEDHRSVPLIAIYEGLKYLYADKSQ